MFRVLVVLGAFGALVAAAAAATSPPRTRPALSISCGRINDGEPVWAPSGRLLAFTRVTEEGGSSAIYRVGLDGKRLRLLSSGFDYAYDPAWSPDGSLIAYSTFDRQAVVRIVVARADGSSPRVLASFQSEREPPLTEITWSPDGQQLAFVGQPDGFPTAAVYAARIDASRTRLIARGAVQPDWSPDGRRIAYALASGITIADASGGDPHSLVDGATPAWSPDGKQVAYESRSSVGVHVISADGSHDRLLDPNGSRPSWSPDGRRLLDVAQAGSRSRYRLHVVDLRNERVMTVTHDSSRRFGVDDLQPSFSPNGTAIAFTSASLSGAPPLGGSELRLVRPDGHNEHRLTYHCTLVDEARATRIDGTALPDIIIGGSGRDQIYSHGGDDTIYARDGKRDLIDCGPGRDLAFADRSDEVARDCETVKRR